MLFCLLRPRGGRCIIDDDDCVISSYPLGCDSREYLARFEVSFRVESICCNGPVSYGYIPSICFLLLTWWWILSRWMCWPGCWRCWSTCPTEYVLC